MIRNQSSINWNASLETLNQSIGILNQSLETLNQSIGILNQSLEILNQSIVILNQSLETLNQSLETLNACLVILNQSLETLNRSLGFLNQSLVNRFILSVYFVFLSLSHMSLSLILILFSVPILIVVIAAIVIYTMKNKSRELSIQFVKINKAEGYLILGDTEERLLFCDILNLRLTSQFHTQWNQHGLDNQKYDLVYSKDGMKQVVSLIVYDSESESVAKRDQLKAIVARLRYDRIQKIKNSF